MQFSVTLHNHWFYWTQHSVHKSMQDIFHTKMHYIAKRKWEPLDQGVPIIVSQILSINFHRPIIIDRVALAKQGDNAIGSIRRFVCPFVCALTVFVARVSILGQGAEGNPFRDKLSTEDWSFYSVSTAFHSKGCSKSGWVSLHLNTLDVLSIEGFMISSRYHYISPHNT